MARLNLLRLAPNQTMSVDPVPPMALTRFPCVVGRHSTCEHLINDPVISRRHCRFALHPGRVWVRDRDSLNGTWLNGEPVTGARPVSDGDRLGLACLQFLVSLSADSAQTALGLVSTGADLEFPTFRDSLGTLVRWSPATPSR